MKAVVKENAAPGLVLRDVPIPKFSSHDILVRVRAASICGTDLHIERWSPWAAERIKTPVVVGHEFAGEVVEVGDEVNHIRIGDTISSESHVICGICDLCRTGQGHLCPNTQILGIDRDGGFAEYVVIPEANAWPDHKETPFEISALQENFGNAVHTAFTADVRAKKVLVTGCGPVGVMTIAVAKAIGARSVYASDINEYRLNLATRMGADGAFDARDDDVVQSIRDVTDGEGVDVLLEMSGAGSALHAGFELLKPGGEAALLGLPGRPIEFDFDNLLIFKGITVYGVIGRRIWETWYQARGLLRSEQVNLNDVITHRFPLENFQDAFDLMNSGNCGKVILTP